MKKSVAAFRLAPYQNNPVLIGEPWGGKTAIIEGLAHRIANEDVPETLKDRKVMTLILAPL